MKKNLTVLAAAALLFIAVCSAVDWQTAGRVTEAEGATASDIVELPQLTDTGEGHDLSGVSDLYSLESFRLHYTLRWQWSPDARENAGYWNIQGEFVREPMARRLVWDSSETAGVTQELIQLGQDLYAQSALGWTVASASGKDIFADNPMLSSPLDILSGYRGQLMQSDVVVNGVAADLYAFDGASPEMTLGLDSTSTARGEVWINREFNVVVKYVVNLQGQHPFAGTPEAGTLHLTFDLTDINEPIHIIAPRGSRPALPEDIPIPEGATEVNTLSGMLAYKVRQSVNELRSFYRNEMMRHGWAEVQASVAGALAFVKDGRTAQIMFSLVEDGAAVAIAYDV